VAYPTPEDLTHGMMVFMTLQVVTQAEAVQGFLWQAAQVTTTASDYLGRIIDTAPPALVGLPSDAIQLSVDQPGPGDDVMFRILLSDPSGIDQVLLIYYVSAAVGNVTVEALLYEGAYYAILPKQGGKTTVQWWIQATDVQGNSATLASGTYTVEQDFTLYIFLIGLIAVVVLSMLVIRRRKKSAIKQLSGNKRYKLIK
jgi:hypothetical protein